jgi:hypothetical protein
MAQTDCAKSFAASVISQRETFFLIEKYEVIID